MRRAPVMVAVLAGLLCLGLAAHPSLARADPEVRAAQARLAELGYDPGPVDGVMGQLTQRALTLFQRGHDLYPSGALDDATRRALGLAAAAPGASPAEEPAPIEPTPTREPEAPALASAGERAEPPEKKPRGPVTVDYDALGWHPPQSGAEALQRYRSLSRRAPTMKRAHGEILVPDAERIYILKQGERIPGYECDPALGRLAVEPLLGKDGPVAFRSLDGKGFCQLGLGVVLMQGETLRLEGTGWLETARPQGTVRIGAKGLELLVR